MSRLINGLKRIFSLIRIGYPPQKELQTTPVNLSEVRDQEEAFEKDRAYHRAELAKAQVENARLKKALQSREPNGEDDPARILNEQLQDMERDSYKGSLDWSMLFKYLLSKRRLRVTSFDSQEIFGYLKTIVTLADGRQAIVVIDQEGKPRIFSGRTFRDIFRNVNGLLNQVALGSVMINWSKDGAYVEDIMTKEVPHLIYGDGKLEFSKYNTAKFGELIAEKDIQINQLFNELGLLEDYLHKQTLAEQKQNIASDFDQKRARVAEATNLSNLKDSYNIMKTWMGLGKENVRLAQAQEIANDSLQTEEKARKKLLEEKEYGATNSSVQTAKEHIQNDVEFLNAVIPKENRAPKKVEKPQAVVPITPQ